MTFVDLSESNKRLGYSGDPNTLPDGVIHLGGSGSLADPFPDKPKSMHWKTYWRLWREFEAAAEAWAVGVYSWIRKIGA